ncbi:MAG TPA: hypothetical protein VIH61_06170 [Waddliaceae bacterium]
MVNQTELTISNFGYYVFHPLSEELSPTDQKIALIGTVLLGFTCGIGHLICYLFFYNRKVEKINFEKSENPPTPPNEEIPLELRQAANPDKEELIDSTASTLTHPNEETFQQQIQTEKSRLIQLQAPRLQAPRPSPNEETPPELPQATNPETVKPAIEGQEAKKVSAYTINTYMEGAKKGDKTSILVLRELYKREPPPFNIEEAEKAFQTAITQKIKEEEEDWAENPSSGLAFSIALNYEELNEPTHAMNWYAEAAKRGNYCCFDKFKRFYDKHPSSFDINEIEQAYRESKQLEINEAVEEVSTTPSIYLRYVAGRIAFLYEQLGDEAKSMKWLREGATRGDTACYSRLEMLNKITPEIEKAYKQS